MLHVVHRRDAGDPDRSARLCDLGRAPRLLRQRVHPEPGRHVPGDVRRGVRTEWAFRRGGVPGANERRRRRFRLPDFVNDLDARWRLEGHGFTYQGGDQIGGPEGSSAPVGAAAERCSAAARSASSATAQSMMISTRTSARRQSAATARCGRIMLRSRRAEVETVPSILPAMPARSGHDTFPGPSQARRLSARRRPSSGLAIEPFAMIESPHSAITCIEIP